MLNEDTILMRLDADLQRPFRGALTTENFNLHNELSVKLRDRIQAFKNKKEPLLANQALSNQGKAEKISQVATGSLGEFKFLNVVATREADTADRLRQDLFTIKTPATLGADPLLQFLFGKDIRDRYTTQQEKDLAFVKASAAEEGNAKAQANRDAVLWAFQQTPGGHTITQDIMDRALEDRARRMEPEVYAQLEQAEIMSEQLGGLRDHVVLWLRGLGADPKKIYDVLGGPEPPEPMLQRTARMMQHA